MSESSPLSAVQHEGSSSSEQWQLNHKQPERKSRFPRACTARSSSRLQYPPPSAPDRRAAPSPSAARKERKENQQCSKIVTPLVEPPSPAQLPRWSLRSMWELASLLNFLHVFRPLLNITVEFSAEELETALIMPNSTLDDIHIPLLKAIPPVTRMALGRATWVTVLCRKLRDWWHWVAEGEIPIVASHGTEVETYKMLEPATRVLILKALCDIRVEQEDIRSYIDNSVKHGIQLSAFRKERFGGDSHGVSYWHEDDPIVGHRLYREIRQIEVKRMKGKGMPAIPLISCQWETLASNLDEFLEVSDKLFESKNRMEASLSKKLKIDVIPEVEKIHKKRERTLKKQHRQALLIDSYLTADGLTGGRSLRDRKPVTYTFDDFDRSINEAIKITKRPTSPEQHLVRREGVAKSEPSSNGKSNDPSHDDHHASYESQSPKFSEYEETDGELKPGALDRRRRKRPQRYSEKDFVEPISDSDPDFGSEDDIVGEAVYDDEYVRGRKQRKMSSSSEGDEYSWQEENAEDEDEEEAEDSSVSEDSDERRGYRKLRTRNRRGTKLRSVDELQTGPRRSKRSTRPRIDYRQYELSESDADSTKHNKSGASDGHSDASNDLEFSPPSQDSQDENGVDAEDADEMDPIPDKDLTITVEKEQNHSQAVEKKDSPGSQSGRLRRTQFLDLNELAPSAGFDDGGSPPINGEDADDF